MISLISDASPMAPLEVIKAALPIGIGLASAAYLTMKIASNSSSGKVTCGSRCVHYPLWMLLVHVCDSR